LRVRVSAPDPGQQCEWGVSHSRPPADDAVFYRGLLRGRVQHDSPLSQQQSNRIGYNAFRFAGVFRLGLDAKEAGSLEFNL